MKNQDSYIKEEILRLTTATSGNCWARPILDKLVTEVNSKLDDAIENGRLKYITQEAVDFAIYKTLDTYH